MLPVVAIVGRPNVGKSSLFNRLAGKRYAIESDVAGTTRDRIYKNVTFHDFTAMLVDTAGLSFGDDDFEEDVQAQAKLAVDEADAILFVVDIMQPLTSLDYQVADLLRKKNKPVILVANKADNTLRQDEIVHFYELGFEKVVAVSALHAHGVDELEHEVSKIFEEAGFSPGEEAEVPGIKIAVMGKSNVGKSSLVNKILGEVRMVVSPVAGTTRDAVDSTFEFEDQRFVLIDTAGIRRRSQTIGLEKYSFLRSLQALARCDVALLLFDATDGVTRQDCRVSSFILEEGKGLIIVVNKSDLLEKGEEGRERFLRQLRNRMGSMPWAPVVFVSALSGKNIEHIVRLAGEIITQREKTIPHVELNRLVKKAMIRHGAAGYGGTTMKVYRVDQKGTNPPRFVFYVNDIGSFHSSFRRYLERSIRDEFGFDGTVVVMDFKQGNEDDEGKKILDVIEI